MKIIAGNWKMNFGEESTGSFFQEFKGLWKKEYEREDLKVIFYVPFVSLQSAQGSKFSSILIGAQNAHWEKSGAFTGEISGPMLRELKIPTVLVGHSERRQFFGESDETVNKKVLSLLEQGFKVMVCVGELLEERESNQTHVVLDRQISVALKGIPNASLQNLVIAYEPVWAIGTGLTATPEQAQEAHAFIRSKVEEITNKEAAEKIPILYGGSLKPSNAKALFACPDIDGGLIGGASLKPKDLSEIIQAATR